jgi:hypothetical protein
MPSPVCPLRAAAPSPGPSLGYLGWDVSQAEVVACLLLPDGQAAVLRWAVPNTAPGGQALAEHVAALAHAHDLTRLRIGLEATGLYWWHLACFLNATPLRYSPRECSLQARASAVVLATGGRTRQRTTHQNGCEGGMGHARVGMGIMGVRCVI